MRRSVPKGFTSKEAIKALKAKWRKIKRKEKAQKRKEREREKERRKKLKEREKRKRKRKPPPIQLPRIPLPPDRVLAEEYLAGGEYRKMALKYGCGTTTIYRCVKRYMMKITGNPTDRASIDKKGNSPKIRQLRKMIEDARQHTYTTPGTGA